VKDLAIKNGYYFQEHNAITDDGYILGIHRIPGKLGAGNRPDKAGKKPPVIMWHGIFQASVCFMINGKENSPAFIAADQGFDVWLGNTRGNTYSRAHTRYKPNRDSDFWDFSFTSAGLGDIPATIDLIQDITKQPKVGYIGHSQGTT
jgi:pimeloyl-ACP methyl ester carboxylesterase